jgi:MFS family permease
MDRQRLINLLAAIAAITVFGFTLGLMFPLLSLIMERQGLSPEVIGYNTAMQPLGIVLSIFTIPFLVKKYSAKSVAICSAWATAAVILCYPFTPIFWSWFGIRILHGFFVSTLFAVSEAWIVQFAAGPWRSRILALYTSALAASFGAGPLLISITGIDGSLPFVIGAIVLAAATLPILFLKEPAQDIEDKVIYSSWSFVGKAPVLLLAVGMFAVIDAANLGLLPVYAVKKGFDRETAALALTAFILGNTVLQFPIGWLADHMPKRQVMAGCGAITAMGMALVPLTFGTWLFWPILVIAGAAAAGIYSVALAELGDRFSGQELITGTACFSMTWGAGALIGALGAGSAMQVFGPDGLPYGLAISFAIFLAIMVWREKQKARPA